MMFDSAKSFGGPDAGNETFRVSNTLPKFIHCIMATSSLMRFTLQSDRRQFAGLLFGLSICATFFPMANLSGLVGPDGDVPTEGVPLSSFVASICVIAIGLTGMLTGYLSLVHDFGHRLLTGWALIIVQTAWIPYITDMTNVGKTAATGAAFIPADYNPTVSNVHTAGAFGILGIFSYGAAFLGSLAFMAFSLYAYQAGKPGARSASYFRGRLRTYSFLILVAGVAQLGLGFLVVSVAGSGPLLPAPGVAMFTVTFPEISIFVGAVYIFNGLFGLFRAFTKPSADNHRFQIGIAMQYFFTVVLMIVVQIAYLPGGMLAAAAPSRSCLTLGIHVLPAFLDYKMRSTPEELSEDYYGLSEDAAPEAAKSIEVAKGSADVMKVTTSPAFVDSSDDLDEDEALA